MQYVGVFCDVVTSCSGAKQKIQLDSENSRSYINSLLCCNINMESLILDGS